jgi:hypothetical protein
MDISPLIAPDLLARRALLNAVMHGLAELRRLKVIRDAGTEPQTLLN